MWLETPLDGASLPAKTVCLTFDDGPGERTLELAQFLAEESIAAAFFFVGQHLEKYPDAPAQVRRLGHIAANHGYSHRKLNSSALSDEDVFASILRTDALLQNEQACAIYFRPPYGAWAPRLSFLLNQSSETREHHVGPVHWDIDGKDYAFWKRGQSPDDCSLGYMKEVAKTQRQSGIVLCHDSSADDQKTAERNRTPEMIRLLVSHLRDQGFRFASLGDLPALNR